MSFTKGCYVGQEVVARLNTYEKVKRYLSKLSLDEMGEMPGPGATLTVDGKEAGKITSVAPVASVGAEGCAGVREEEVRGIGREAGGRDG